ncbi:helix-turn-helix transcriptional regulator [Actinokineospora iranica]|uniref:DNA-binding response regulator, NarL/FixJ family, contains REC and HTH domains n=1 Tax=Actinokineospora iranica TaxID=1271860 RepID=A0A1G6MFH8_9PSEU|nr:hypothetical protein [Actinokineospora iranica]SDC54027.1 DNA-binding response regulator, NarL/FixJ family, contains REC and HTH domains [Actinokineospora iranica]
MVSSSAAFLVHHGLRAQFLSRSACFADNGIALRFADTEELFSAPMDGRPVLVPALSGADHELIRAIRAVRCMEPVVGVVDDINGHQTFEAMQSGASSVFNVRLPWERQIAVLDLLQASSFGSAETRPTARSAEKVAADSAALNLDAENAELIELLCGNARISTIAQQLYCSERSLYRRIRRLYEQVGVTGRAELRRRSAKLTAV